MTLNPRSLKNLEGVHPDLVAVVTLASAKAEFLVTEGKRSKERQLDLVKAGKSQTKNSRHLYGLAVDLCDCDGCYDAPDMTAISRAMKAAAAELGTPICWGGDWKTFKDTPHFELDRKKYPDDGGEKPRVVKPGTPARVAIGGVIGGAVSVVAPIPPVPVVPDVVSQTVANVNLWKGIGVQVWELKSFAIAQPVMAGVVGLSVLVVAFWPKRKQP